MAHEPNSKILKLEIECVNINIKPISSQSQNSLSNNLPNTSTNSRTNQTVNNTTGSVSAKMGSRRIFTPQFKLQVLESYRNDSDCKGNQRATARKYGIHRRQIQKWLQCENNLRSSVANLNQNNMKHQFHNISHHHQIPVVSSSTTAITATTATHTTNNINNNNNNNQQYKTNILSLDSTRHSVGLTPRPMTVQVPVPVAPLATSAIVAPSTVMAASPPSRPATTIKCASDSNISAITATPVSTTSPLLKSPTHTITKIQAPSYNINTPVVLDTMLTHTPAISNISSVPLVHHYSQHHYSQQPHQSHSEQHQSQHQQEQQHSYSHHYYHVQHQHQQYENRLLMPSASLPMPRSNSPVLTATNRTDELRDYQPITMTGNCYMKEDCRNEQQTYENFHYCTTKSGLIAPIDLSLGPRQAVYEGEIQVNARHNMNDDETKMNIVQTTNVWPEMEANNNECKDIFVKNEIEESSQIDSQAIDLTCRKRKNYNENDAPAEKIPKTYDTNGKEPTDVSSDRKPETGTENVQQPKPVKLFKPYLLDDNESNNTEKVKSEPHDPIIWSYHPNCATTSANYDNQTLNNFQSTEHGYPFPTGSPTFQRDSEHSGYATATGTPSPSGYITRTTPPITTPSALWCPKGSPVSGYDSASTYSDSSDYVYRSQHQYHHHYPPPQCQTYSLDLKMQPVDSYYYDMTCRADQLCVGGKLNVHRNDVQRWLDQENDIRQGIAVYV